MEEKLEEKMEDSYVSRNFFKFPIKLYDVYSAVNAELMEDRQIETEGHITPVHADWATVIKVCKPKDIIGWVESGDRGQDVKDLSTGTPPITVVSIREGLAVVSYECTWRRDKFESKLNEKMRAYIA